MKLILKKKLFTPASDQAKKDLREFLMTSAPDIRRLDPGDAEIFRQGVVAFGEKWKDPYLHLEVPEKFEEVLGKMRVPKTVISQVRHWEHQLRPELRERYNKMLKRAGKDTLFHGDGTDLDKESWDSYEKTWKNIKKEEEETDKKDISKSEDIRKIAKTFKKEFGKDIVTFNPGLSCYNKIDHVVNIDPKAIKRKDVLYHEFGHLIDKINGTLLPTTRINYNGQSYPAFPDSLTTLANENMANTHGKKLMKYNEEGNEEVNKFCKLRKPRLHTYQADILLGNGNINGKEYQLSLGRWLHDNDSKKRKSN